LKLAGVHISLGDTVQSFSSADAAIGGNAHSDNVAPLSATPQDLLRQLDGARQALETQLAGLRAADTAHLHTDMASNASANLQRLNMLSLQLAGGAKDVTALRADIASALADIRAYTSDIRNAVSTAQNGTASQVAQAALYEANASAQRTVSDFTRDYYEKHVFDRYLKFTSAEDEEAYRHREEERRQAIDRANAEGTPEGNLKANQLALAQLEDAGAHGADRSPDYNKWHNALRTSCSNLSSAIEATRPHAEAAFRSEQRDSVKPDAKVSPELLAALRDAGVTVPDQNGTGHGVTTNAKPADKIIGHA